MSTATAKATPCVHPVVYLRSHMKTSQLKTSQPIIIAALVAGAFAIAGCGSSDNGTTQASTSAATKAQVSAICVAAIQSLNAQKLPLTQSAAVAVQRHSAQIISSAAAKLHALEVSPEMRAEFQSWLGEFEQVGAANEAAAQAFSQHGETSDQAVQAGTEFEARTKKANGLAKQAGLDACVIADPQPSA